MKGRIAQHAKYFINLLDIILSWKQRVSQKQLHNYTAKWKHIDSTAVLLGAKQILWSPVPSRGDIISRNLISLYGKSKIY